MNASYELIPFTVKTEADGVIEYHSLSYETSVLPEDREHYLTRLILATLGVKGTEKGVVWYNEAGVMNAIPEREEMLRVAVRPHLRMTVRAVDQYKAGRHQDLFDITLFSSIPTRQVRFLLREIQSLFWELDYGHRTIAYDYDLWLAETIDGFLTGIPWSLGAGKVFATTSAGLKYRKAEEVFDFMREQMDFTFEIVFRDSGSVESLPLKSTTRRWLHSHQPFYRPWVEQEEATTEEDIRAIEEVLREKERLYAPAMEARVIHYPRYFSCHTDEVDPSVLTYLSEEMREEIFNE